MLLPRLFSLGLALAASTSPAALRAESAVARLQAAALPLTLPSWETTPEAVVASTEAALAAAQTAYQRIGAQPPDQLTFATTAAAIDSAAGALEEVGARLYLIKSVSVDPALRAAAGEAVKRIQEFQVSIEYREDLHAGLRRLAESSALLTAEERRLLDHQLRDFRRAGLALPPEARAEVERLRKELVKAETDFTRNIAEVSQPVLFTRAELEGVPESFLASPGVKTGEDAFTLQAQISNHYLAVSENARRPETRRRIEEARARVALEKNVPLLAEMVRLRGQIAQRLGYASWTDYVTEPRMAGSAATAVAFLEKLTAGLQPKYDAELAELQALKAAETGQKEPRLESWDWRYYSNQLRRQRYQLDAEALRVFFPFEATCRGMFSLYEELFSLRIETVSTPNAWHPEVSLHLVRDAAGGELLGAFYFDPYPRAGKFNHFALFPVVPSKRREDGSRQPAVCALICNFPAPSEGNPSLLSLRDVEVLFHEFGHCLHEIVTQSRFARFAGTQVARDFVEAPSQMLERWVRKKEVLDRFAADYRDPSKKIPQETLDRLEAARLGTIGIFYRRQMAYAFMDQSLHARPAGEPAPDVARVTNAALARAFLPPPEGTVTAASVTHMAGYDGGYYGYAWADSIAADLATAFVKAPGGFLDREVGRRLRDVIYAPGNTRDAGDLVEAFLGRPRSLQPFLETLGIEKP